MDEAKRLAEISNIIAPIYSAMLAVDAGKSVITFDEVKRIYQAATGRESPE